MKLNYIANIIFLFLPCASIYCTKFETIVEELQDEAFVKLVNICQSRDPNKEYLYGKTSTFYLPSTLMKALLQHSSNNLPLLLHNLGSMHVYAYEDGLMQGLYGFTLRSKYKPFDREELAKNMHTWNLPVPEDETNPSAENPTPSPKLSPLHLKVLKLKPRGAVLLYKNVGLAMKKNNDPRCLPSSHLDTEDDELNLDAITRSVTHTLKINKWDPKKPWGEFKPASQLNGWQFSIP